MVHRETTTPEGPAEAFLVRVGSGPQNVNVDGPDLADPLDAAVGASARTCGAPAPESLLNWSAMTIDSNLAKVDEVMTALYDIHDPEIGMSIVDLDLIKNVEIGDRWRPDRDQDDPDHPVLPVGR